MKYFILAASLFLIACGGDMQDEKDFQKEVYRDNHTYIEIRDNSTSVVTTTTTTSTNNQTTSTTSSSDSTSNSGSTNTTDTVDPMIRMMNLNTFDMTAALWALNSMPTLTFFIEGDSKRYQINQNGHKPNIDNFSESETGFFTYTIKKDEMNLVGADVYSDNTSAVYLKWRTNIYTFVANRLGTIRYEMAPIEFTIRVN